ncbi:hypothetical protein [Ascidiaceihabitans sp.]
MLDLLQLSRAQRTSALQATTAASWVVDENPDWAVICFESSAERM